MLDYLCLITPLAMSPLRDELQQLSKAQQLSLSSLMDKYNGVKAASGAAKAIVVVWFNICDDCFLVSTSLLLTVLIYFCISGFYDNTFDAPHSNQERPKTAVPLTKSGVPSVKVINSSGASAASNTGAPQSSKQKAQQCLEEDYLMKPSNDRVKWPSIQIFMLIVLPMIVTLSVVSAGIFVCRRHRFKFKIVSFIHVRFFIHCNARLREYQKIAVTIV